jgi:hypothetical protein
MRKILLGLSLAALPLTACSTARRHRTIIFDQTWSSEAGVRNLSCVPEQSASCAREARDSELSFSKRLVTAFQLAPECATVRLIVPSVSDNSASNLGNGLRKDAGYWRLRVDFHPRLAAQPFTLGLGEATARVAGDDTEHSAAFICEAVKNNVVTAIW